MAEPCFCGAGRAGRLDCWRVWAAVAERAGVHTGITWEPGCSTDCGKVHPKTEVCSFWNLRLQINFSCSRKQALPFFPTIYPPNIRRNTGLRGPNPQPNRAMGTLPLCY